MIDKLPTYAQAAARSFRDTGRLSGEGVQRQSIPAEHVDAFQSQMVSTFQRVIEGDDKPGDLLNGKGQVGSEGGGLKMTANYQGDTKQGEMVLETSGELASGAYGHFSDERAIIVQAADQGDQGTGVMAAFIDRKNPANSYIEAYNFAGGLPF